MLNLLMGLPGLLVKISPKSSSMNESAGEALALVRLSDGSSSMCSRNAASEAASSSSSLEMGEKRESVEEEDSDPDPSPV